jgi:lipopolysaccharide transport system ATP-binding protein
MRRAEIRRRFDEIVAFAEVEKFIDTPVKRYSSGMYVRLAFAIAAHLDPEILLVDEVLAVGDAEFQNRCLGKMSDVAHGGRTILFVSHNMHAVEKICGRVLHLDHGRLAGDYDNASQGIASYLRGSGGAAAGAIWVNPGGECMNDYFVPERLEVSSLRPGALPGEPFSNAYPVAIEISGTVRQQHPALHVGVSMLTDDGELLFQSFCTDRAQDRWPRLETGPVRLRAELPARFLNEGVYRIQVIADVRPFFWLLEPELGASPAAVTFSIQGGLSESPVWNKRRQGILAPVLGWENF